MAAMAQAARLNLRMQKELKLLLTDPPPGASFPTLSNQHHGDGAGAGDFSLTSIDALLQGPEDTVYSNGLFKIKIQIPERYPFQPPIVTFATPIYHPNIDTGGRICLDILNLPPKGMWQPSLNISTVLTSIGLLLSEPNPDDGLMHEASRDYKYNRQAFDQNARSMTEKYAQAGVTDTARGENGSQTHTNQSTSQVSLLYCSSSPQTKMEGSVASICPSKHRKLSLESQGCSNNVRDNGEETPKVPIHNSSTNRIEIEPLKEASKDPPKYTGKLTSGRFKLLPKVAVAPKKTNGESGNTTMSNQCSLALDMQTTSDSPAPSLVQAGNISSIRDEGHVETSHTIKRLQSLHSVGTNLSSHSHEKSQSIPRCSIPHLDSVRPQKVLPWSYDSSHTKADFPKDAIARKGYSSTSIRLKKRGLVGVMPSSESSEYPQNHSIDDKENLAPYRCLFPEPTEQAAVSAIKSAAIPGSGTRCIKTEIKAVINAPKLSETAVKLPLNQLQASNSNVIMHPENLSTDDVRVGKKQHTIKVCDRGSAETLKEVAAEAVIVLDSEDSDDENVPVRSKLCLAKRCLSGKRKLGFR